MPGSGNLATMTILRFGGRMVMADIVTAILLAFLESYVSWIPVAALSTVILRVGLTLIEWRMLRKVFAIKPISPSSCSSP